ncbi:MAG: Gfo/Idh/MocA family oxidoreductase [Oscillospiraceae bacterium]
MLRFAIVGTGNISRRFIAAIGDEPTCEAVALLSRNSEGGKAFAKEFSIPLVFDTIEDLCAAPGIDAVYIANPNGMHASTAIQMLLAGKHVLCEKPIASTLPEAQAMVVTARQCGKVLLEAMPTLFYPGFDILRTLLPRVGTLRRVTAVYCQYSSRYDAVKNGEQRNAFDRTLGNAALLDLGIYCIEPTLALLGLPEELCAKSVFLNGFEAQGTVTARFGGAQADFIYSKISDSRLPSEIQGEDGSIIVARWPNMEHFTLLPREGAAEEFSAPLCENDLVYELRAFIKMVSDGTGHEVYNDLSLAAMSVIDKAREIAKITF